MPPPGEQQHHPDIKVRVAQEVDAVAVGTAEDRVHHALVLGQDQLGEEADDRQRQRDREVQRALVEPAEPQLAVEQDGQEDPERGGDQPEEDQPQQVVADRRTELGVDRQDVVVVLDPYPLDRRDAVVVGEGQQHGDNRRAPDQGQVEDDRHADDDGQN